jgi:hypothetical protein
MDQRRNIMKMLERLLVSTIMVGILVLSGCETYGPKAKGGSNATPSPNATLGSSFQQTDKIPAGKAVVYIYHSGGSNHLFFLQINGKDVTRLRRGMYYTYVTEPGVIEFTAKTMGASSINLDAKAGQAYYLKGSVPPGFAPTPSLVLVSPEIGAKEIADYKLIP